jgi:hypothetical protein
MTIFKKLALSAALAACAVTGAQAASVTEYSSFYLVNSTENTPGVFTGTYPIDSVTDAAPTDINGVPLPARVAGDTFVDDFLFSIQDTQQLSFYATVNPGLMMGFVIPSALFDSITVYDFQGGVYVPAFRLDTQIGFYESGLTLHSGAYAIEVTGSILTDGGGYKGIMTTVPVVPEPSSLALMLAGVGAMALLARRRKTRA